MLFFKSKKKIKLEDLATVLVGVALGERGVPRGAGDDEMLHKVSELRFRYDEREEPQEPRADEALIEYHFKRVWGNSDLPSGDVSFIEYLVADLFTHYACFLQVFSRDVSRLLLETFQANYCLLAMKKGLKFELEEFDNLCAKRIPVYLEILQREFKIYLEKDPYLQEKNSKTYVSELGKAISRNVSGDDTDPLYVGSAIVVFMLKLKHFVKYYKEIASKYKIVEPDFAVAHFELGTALSDKGETDEAIREYREAIRLKPDLAEVHFSLGAALFEKGETEEAIKEHREAIRLKPDYAEAHYGLGWALDQKGERKEARGYFERAVKLEKVPELAEWIKKRLAEPR